MTKMFRLPVTLVLCLGSAAAVSAQSSATPVKPTTAQQPAATSTQQSSPNQMTTNPGSPGLPPLVPPSADDVKRCGDKVPEGGVPTFWKAETPEQRRERLGTAEDPGCDPDQTAVYSRFGQQYTILRYERMWAEYDMPGTPFLRPFGYANMHRELYQQNERYVWAWEPVTDPNAAPPKENLNKSTQSGRVYTDKEVEVLQRLRTEFFPLKVSDSGKTITFEESSAGLPKDGSWRNGLAVADMNGDGKLDIIAPAERAGGFYPTIFLGDGKGGWKVWEDAKWPHPIAYGSVVAADFNKDGKMDLAFAAHLDRVYVLLGDGKGHFTDSDTGLPTEFGSRRLIVADLNNDGWPDLVVASEGPTAVHSAPEAISQIRGYVNEKGKKWTEVRVAGANERVAGDWLAAGDFNGDKRIDFSSANIYMGSPATIYMGKPGLKWAPLDPQMGRIIPYLSYYFATAAGKVTSKTRDDAIVSYVRFWPKDVNPKLVPTPPLVEVTGIDRVSFEDGAPKRTPIIRWGNKFGVTGLALGDFDGDGNLDIVYTNPETPSQRNITILLGDGKGGFRRAAVEGLVGQSLSTYDLKVADVNGDGKPDIIIMYESDEGGMGGSKGGSIHVFLNRGSR